MNAAATVRSYDFWLGDGLPEYHEKPQKLH